jgi:hypothetical protein
MPLKLGINSRFVPQYQLRRNTFLLTKDWLIMRYYFAKVIATIALSTCCWAAVAQTPTTPTVQTNSARSQLLRLWSAPHLHSWERAEAVNRHFTNGTPVSAIVAVLGTNFTYFTPYSTVWISPGPAPTKTTGLIYDFGDESVIIGTTAPLMTNGVHPLQAKFTGAGYSKPASRSVTESNRTRPAAGSGR